MINEVISAITIIAERWATIIMQRVQAKWNNMAGMPGETVISKDVTATPSMILASIYAGGMKAFIAEEGSGSLLNRDNPNLAEYISSEFFNPLRLSNDFKITGRDAGEYVTLDGDTEESSGTHAGRIIESSRSSSEFRAFKPAHVIEGEIRNALPEIEAEIFEVVCGVILDEMVAKFPKRVTV